MNNVTIENFLFSKKFGDKKAYEMIKTAGFEGVDFSFNKPLENGKWGAIDLGDYIKTAKEHKLMLSDNGLSCEQAHAPFDSTRRNVKFDMNDDLYFNTVRSIQASGILGIK